jgi:NAD(P)-dependent dehydrogenase (short-subunit alcohol dehydrogenase family)
MMQRYAGRVVLITGASQGLGRAMADRFAREGAHLAVCDINPQRTRSTGSDCHGLKQVMIEIPLISWSPGTLTKPRASQPAFATWLSSFGATVDSVGSPRQSLR